MTSGSNLAKDIGRSMLNATNEKIEHNVIFLSDYSLKRMFGAAFKEQMKNSDKVIVHALFSPTLLLFLLVHGRYNRKAYWIIWGGDLYSYLDEELSFKLKILDAIRKVIVQRFAGIGVLVNGDFEILKKKYKYSGKNFIVRYPDEFQEKAIEKILKEENEQIYKSIRVIVGNSATESNGHLEAFKMLEKYKEYPIEIFCPLSYGDMEYAKKVISIGKEIFDEKFIPIVDYMEKEDYLRFLRSMDVGIYNCNRQQALGNIYALLKFGKKVYLQENTSMWKQIHEYDNILVYSLSKLPDSFCDFAEEETGILKMNQEKALEIYSLKESKKLWDLLFQD